MKQRIVTDIVSSALSAALWTLMTWLLFRSLGAFASSLLAFSLLKAYGTAFLIAFVMHRLFARRITATRGLEYWGLPVLTIPLSALLWALVHLSPAFFDLLRWPALWEDGIVLRRFGHSILRYQMTAVDLCWLTYPLMLGNQLMIRRLYQGAFALRPPPGALRP